ncbi:MAG TPA: GH25 family lysozyme [Anaeromyxobacteraceae bacterium]|nr:GH25 family lysozyme [Anaeromyxobacteraceae bacterium]
MTFGPGIIMPDSLLGIDVSHHNGTVNWSAVASAGVSFAYAKASEGANVQDPMFVQNYAAMRANRLYRGAYHFFHPGTDASVQARHFLALVPELASGDLPPALDVEVGDGQQPSAIAAGIRAWLQEVEDAIGRPPVLYTSASFWNVNLAGAIGFDRYPLWIAHYTTEPQPHLPSGFTRHTMWQYTDSGQVAGIVGVVDLDRFHGTLEELKTLAKP